MNTGKEAILIFMDTYSLPHGSLLLPIPTSLPLILYAIQMCVGSVAASSLGTKTAKTQHPPLVP